MPPRDADSNSDRVGARLSAVAALAEPVRRALYRFVASRVEAVSRDEAAAGVGVAHHVAKFNLDRLVDEGLLEAEYRRPPGRGGPGAGRPAKLYRRSHTDLVVSVPERRYDQAGRLLAVAVARAEREGRPAGTVLRDVATEAGREIGAAARASMGARPRRAELTASLVDALADNGYEPNVVEDGVSLVNCPFDALARDETDLVCGMNLAFCEGIVDGLQVTHLGAVLDPARGRCCVRFCRP